MGPLLATAALLALAPSATSQLDTAACKAARKELAKVTRSAAFEHRVQLVDAVIAFGFTIAFPLADAQGGTFDADSLETMRSAADGLLRDLQESTVAVSEIVAAQIPWVLSGAFGGPLPGPALPAGFLPGDGAVLDDFRDKLAKQQAKVTKGLAKSGKQLAKMLHEFAGVELNWILVAPEVAWAAGDSSGWSARAPRPEALDLLLAARGLPVGVRVLASGWADEAAGDVLVELIGPDGAVADSQTVTPDVDRWSATFADVDVNPAIVRVSRAGVPLAQRVIGIR